MIQELLVKLTADNKDLKAKLNQSESQVKGFGGSMKQVGLMAVAGFAMAGAAVLAFGIASFKAAQEQEQANKRLMFALKGNTVAYKSLTDQAEKLRSQTGVDDAAIMQIQQLGANAGYTTDKIKKITQAAVELSAVTGQDLQAAYMQINMTLAGSAGRLTRLDAEFGTLTETQLRNGAAIDLILTKYQGFAANSATEVQKLSSNWDEFTERLGGVTLPLINSFFSEVNTAMRMSSDNALSFWEKLTMPRVVYRDIENQKKLLENAGKTATDYYRSIMGVNTVSSAMNQISGSITQLSGPTISPGKKKTSGTKVAKETTNPFWDMPEQAKTSFDKLAEYMATSSQDEFNYNAEVENSTQQMLNTNEEAYSTYYNNLLSKKIAFALTEATINKRLSDDQLQTLSQTAGAAASIFAEQTAAYKVFASAQAAIDTYAAANASYKALAGIPVVGPALAAISAGVAIAAGLANVAKINGVAFAEGGIVSGPTQALVGEYAGARSNPEIIAPLDKLKSIMGNNRQTVEVIGYISGDVIRLANKRSTYLADRRG